MCMCVWVSSWRHYACKSEIYPYQRQTSTHSRRIDDSVSLDRAKFSLDITTSIWHPAVPVCRNMSPMPGAKPRVDSCMLFTSVTWKLKEGCCDTQCPFADAAQQ